MHSVTSINTLVLVLSSLTSLATNTLNALGKPLPGIVPKTTLLETKILFKASDILLRFTSYTTSSNA